jgi:hypothetical protein
MSGIRAVQCAEGAGSRAGEARDGTIGRVQPAPATVTVPMRDIPRQPEPTTNPGACCFT